MKVFFSCLLILSSLVLFIISTNYDGLPSGPYCARRNIGCCPNRKDECSAEIIGTLCYCDQFCNRTRNSDCCPDYWSHCLNMDLQPEALAACEYKGQYFGYRKTVKVNCNDCSCQNAGSRLEMICTQEECMIDPALIDSINIRERGLLWRASNYSEFWGKTLKEGLKFKLGTKRPGKMVRRMQPIPVIYDSLVPKSFDANEKWPGYITKIQDQNWCGSSWALSTVAVSNDRFAIFTQGREHVSLSAQELISCASKGQQGCSGGYVDRAWRRIMKQGIVSERCYPYKGSDSQCELSRDGMSRFFHCPTGNNENRVYHVSPAYRVSNESEIMAEILRNGPVQAVMKVYRDFFSYRDGIYHHSNGDSSHEFDYHAVRIVGWSEEYTSKGLIKYWKAANTWGQQWGENGYFRILKGQNECEIEDFVVGSWPQSDFSHFEQNSVL